ncbi:MAG: B12 binding domain protein [Methanosaeta sp. PtaU1.Bin112]|nr:MAG: B12 binding domain protein [Methanosaeta sp. PtaU1.Bin112]
MNILLTSAPVFDVGSAIIEPDIGSCRAGLAPCNSIYLLASIARSDHQVCLQDPAENYFEINGERTIKVTSIDREVSLQFPAMERNLKYKDAVCISATSFNWFFGRLMAKRVHELDRDLPIIAGGIHPTLADRHILETTDVDYIVRGEGERTFPELLSCIENGRALDGVDGISYRENNKIVINRDRHPLSPEELDCNPLPALDLLPSGIYSKICVETSRGCRFNCIFCTLASRGMWRSCSPQAALKRFEHAIEYAGKLRRGRKNLSIVDGNFAGSRKRSEEILQGLKAMDLGDFLIDFEARVDDLIRSDILDLCKDLPLDFILAGIECGYPSGLRRIRKGIDLKMVEKCAAKAREKSIAIYYSFILGFPWESRNECLQTVEFADKLVTKYDGWAIMNWFQQFPGSRLWDERRAFGIDDSLDIFDTMRMFHRDYRLKMSAHLKEEDFKDIVFELSKCNMMQVLLGGSKTPDASAPPIPDSACPDGCGSSPMGRIMFMNYADDEAYLRYLGRVDREV